MFAVFAFDGPSITAPAPSNGLCFNDGRSEGSEKEDERFPSFEELLLDAGGGAQESQKSGLRSGEDKGANTDSSSVHSESDGSTFVAGSEARYDP